MKDVNSSELQKLCDDGDVITLVQLDALTDSPEDLVHVLAEEVSQLGCLALRHGASLVGAGEGLLACMALVEVTSCLHLAVSALELPLFNLYHVAFRCAATELVELLSATKVAILAGTRGSIRD